MNHYYRRIFFSLGTLGTFTFLVGNNIARSQTEVNVPLQVQPFEKPLDGGVLNTADLYSLYFSKGVELTVKEEFDQALPFFEKALGWDAQKPGVHYYLGLCHLKLAKFNLALNEFQKALQLKPQQIEVMKHLSEAYELSGQAEEALNVYHQILKINPLEFETQIKYARKLKQMGEIGQAISLLQDSVKNPQTPLFIFVELVKLYAHQKAWTEALLLIDEALKRFPNEPSVRDLQAKIFMQMGQKEKAVSVLEKNLQAKPGRRESEYLLKKFRNKP